MSTADRNGERVFRIWIAQARDWLPRCWNDVPPAAVALEPAEAGCLVADEARVYLEGFNQRMLAEARPLWAVALPVRVQYAGDAEPGQAVKGHEFK
jgi:hypothetical protein